MMTDNDQAVDNSTAIILPDPATLPPGARVELVDVDGKQGVIVRAPNGKFLPGTRSHSPITHENARERRAARYEAARERFAAGMTAAAIARGRIPASGAPLDAWESTGEHVTGVVLDADTPRAMSDLARVVAQFSGMVPATDRGAAAASDNGDSVTATITAPADVVLAVLAELRRRSGDLG